MSYVPFEEFGIMRNLRTVGIAKTRGKIMNIQGNIFTFYNRGYLLSSTYNICNSQYTIWIYFFIARSILASRDTLDASGSTVVQRLTFQEFAPGLEHLDLVNSGITEIDEVCENLIAELYKCKNWQLYSNYQSSLINNFCVKHLFCISMFKERIPLYTLGFSHGPFK